ncbi:polysaccharide deacetylase family protein [Psychroflexus sp. YR1-1]|uniref:Polysaccharide deacetylase family protein n=1 Tax=Psychroflexus aurantiacus TaxID=2709310 RepID=A0A6B3R8S0_9FLAO|nr:polysaccharide deacetylase family protein [Psychroflexus aurantiacus]NEV93934.1 polysaccharide deacetylase family protein [Psychroflexus aurantiacus]
MQFKNQISLLSAYGQFVSQKDLLDNTEEIIRSDKKFLLLTFDDGLKEQYEIAKPILDQLGIPAIYFINSINHIEKKVSMVHKIQLVRSVMSPARLINEIQNYNIRFSKAEVQKAIKHYNYDSENAALTKYLLNFKLETSLRDQIIDKLFDEVFTEEDVADNLYMDINHLKTLGDEFSLGNHTHSHLALGLQTKETITEEINQTKEFLENTTHQEIVSISYPYGSREVCTQPVEEIARQTNHKLGFTMTRDYSKHEDSFLMLNRFDCNDVPGGKNEKMMFR